MRIRNFQPSDLDDYVAFHNAAEATDPNFKRTTADEMRVRVLEDPSYDPRGHFIALDDGKLVASGRGMFVPEHVKVKGPVGYFELYIKQCYAGTEIEKKVFAKIVKYLKAWKIERIETRVDTSYEARVHLLERLGFSKNDYQNHGMERQISRTQEPNPPKGYRIRAAEMPRDMEIAVSVLNEAFSTRDKYVPTSLGKFRRSRFFMAGRGTYEAYFAERCKDRQPVGLIIGWIDREYNISHRSRRGGSYALAVIPPERNKGIGTALLLESLKWIGEKGMDVAYLNVNVSNRDALKIYQSLGYHTVQVFQGYWLSIE